MSCYGLNNKKLKISIEFAKAKLLKRMGRDEDSYLKILNIFVHLTNKQTHSTTTNEVCWYFIFMVFSWRS